MNEVPHEKSLIDISAGTAKESKKSLDRFILYISIIIACSISPTVLLIYFSLTANTTGIVSFAVTTILAYSIGAILLFKYIPKARECRQIIKDYTARGEKLKKEPSLDVFCITAVKIMFTLLASFLICSVPAAITVCSEMSFLQALNYIGGCLGSFWGMGNIKQDFFSYLIGIGIMAGIFALILLLIKFVNKLLK